MDGLIRLPNGTIIVPREEHGRLCLRCGANTHPHDPAHLCKDVVSRVREQNDRDWSAYAREILVYGGEA